MKKSIFILALAVIAVMLPAAAMATHQLSGPGDVVVDIRDELGNQLTGATATLRLPAADGQLDIGFDVVLTEIDGVATGGTADGDGLAVPDGDVEFSSASPTVNFGGNIANGQTFRITVDRPGFVTYVQEFTWNSAAAPNVVASAGKFTIKVVLRDELGNVAPPGGSVSITGGLAATDGTAPDGDGILNGIIYLAQDPAALSAPVSASFTEDGFLNYSDNSQTITSAAQTVYYTAFQFPFKITANNELGNTMQLNPALAAVTGLPLVSVGGDGAGALYFAGTGGPSALTLAYPGFITVTSVSNGYSYSSAGAQQLIRFTGTDGPPLTYSIKVLGAQDDHGNVVAIPSGSPFSSAGFNIISQSVSGGYGYVAASASAGTLFFNPPGYVPASATVTPDTIAQQTVGFGAIGAGVDGSPVQQAFKLANAEDELGNVLILSGADSYKLFTDPGCVAEATYDVAPVYQSDAVAWVAGVATGTYYAQYGQPGYVKTCSSVAYTFDGTAQKVTDFTVAASQPVLFPVKVIANDELGAPITGLSITDFSLNGVLPAQMAGSALYYTGGSPGPLTGSHSGFINIDPAIDTQLATVSSGDTSQTVITLTGTAPCATGASVATGTSATCSGLKYKLRVNVSDELGNPVTGLSVSDLIHYGLNASALIGNSMYFTSLSAGGLTSAKSGYININPVVDTQLATAIPGTAAQTVVNLTGPVACSAGGSVNAGTTVTCSGLKYSVKVTVADELGTPVPGIATGTIMVGTATVAASSGNALYFPVAGAGAMAGGVSGYVNINTATDTSLASVQPGITAQTVVNLAGSVPCAGANVGAGTTVTCTGLPYTVKLIAANTQNELGNALVPSAADSFNLYTDAACTTAATYVAGPVFSVNAWYAAVPDGSFYAKYGKGGYISRCDATSVAAAQAGPVANPNFLLANSDGLPFSLKLIVNDELGNAVPGMLVGDVTIGGTAASAANTNSLYYQAAAPGAAAGARTGYVSLNSLLDTQLASVSPGVATQTVVTFSGAAPCAGGGSIATGTSVTCSGLKFGIKVNVSDELGNALPGVATSEVMINGANAVAATGNTLFYSGGTGVMSSGKSGFVNVNTAANSQLGTINSGMASQTVINLIGGVPCATGGSVTPGATVTCNGLKYAAKLVVNDKYGAPVAGILPTDILLGGTAPAYVSGNSLYYGITAAGAATGTHTAYDNIKTTIDTQLASVNPGVVAQTIVTMTGTTACAAGGSVAAGASVTCRGLQPETIPPVVVSTTTGDDTWRTADPGGIYDASFSDAGGSNLSYAQYAAWTGAAMTGSNNVAWATFTSGMNAPTFSATFSVQFASLSEGVNYISVRAWDNAGNMSAIATDAFYIRKDTLPPTGGTIGYTAGYYPTGTVDVSYATGTDAGSGILSTQIERRSAPLNIGACGAYGSWGIAVSNPPSSPFSNTSVNAGNCYEYRFVETDNTAHVETVCTDGAACAAPAAANVTSMTGALDCNIFGDLSHNGQVNLVDAAIFMNYYSQVQTLCDHGDINGDGIVNMSDTLLLKQRFSNYVLAPGIGTPEAASASSTVSFSLRSSKGFVAASDTFDVGVVMNSGAEQVAGLSAYLSFDPAVLNVTNISVASMGLGSIAATSSNVTGAINISLSSVGSSPVSGFNNAFATITFQTLKPASTTINFESNAAANHYTAVLIEPAATLIFADAAMSGISLVAETTPPSAPAYVYDSLGADEVFATSPTQLSANWGASADPESGIAGYWISVGTTAGASDTLTWTDAGAITATTTALTLTNGQIYYFSVMAENGANMFSTPTVSNGVTVDFTPPAAVATVNDGPGADAQYATSATTLSANWTASSDPESGVARYWYSIGTTAGASNTVPWTNAATATTFTNSGLTLMNGQIYFTNVFPENNAGLYSTSTASSNGVTVFLVPPSSAITSPVTGSALNALASITGTATDSTGTGLAVVEISIKNVTDSQYWTGSAWQAGQAWNAASGTASWTLGGASVPAWTNAKTYNIQSRATGIIGLVETPGAGVTFDFDTSPPPVAITSPADGLLTKTAAQTISGTTEASATVTVNGASAPVTGTTFSQGITLKEGPNTITAVATDRAGNSATKTITITLDTTPPDATISSPAAAATVSGTVSISGTASDAHFQNFVLEYGAGSSPSAWKTFASSTTQVTSGTLGSADMSRLSGQYTARLTANDTLGNTNSAYVTFTVSGNLGAVDVPISQSVWNMISLPIIPDATSTAMLLAPSAYKLYWWNPAASYDPTWGQYQRPVSISAGKAMWIKSTGPVTDKILTITGAPSNTTADYEYKLGTGWNMFGVPFNWSYSWANVKVKHNAQTLTLDQAIAAGLVENTPFYFDGLGWRQLSESSPAKFSPGVGYFLYVPATDTVSLLYTPGAEDPSGVARVVRNTPDVEVNISARSAAAADADNFIGLLSTASDGYDGADLREPPPGMDKYLSLSFPHTDWQRGAGRYANDFRAPAGKDAGCSSQATATVCKTWDASVQTNAGGAVTLSWKPLSSYADKYTITLTDLATGATVDMIAQTQYQYTASGSASEDKRFRITVVKKNAQPSAVSHSLAPGWNLISVPLEPEVTSAMKQIGDDLNMFNIYQFFDNRFTTPADALGVDIQSGVGYWLYVPGQATINIEGTPNDPATPVQTPLKTGWNLIGNPFADPISWGDNITIICGANRMALSAAATGGWVDGRLYSYDDAAGAYTVIQQGGALDPWKGYLMKSKHDCAVEFKK